MEEKKIAKAARAKNKAKKIPACRGSYEEYLIKNMGNILEALYDLIVNGKDERIKLKAIDLWTGKVLANKQQLQLPDNNTTNVLILPTTEDANGRTSIINTVITLPELKKLDE